ncbi:MAG: tetraacyldisaccharide 4'-kinase [Candidatus Omnitrophica bacterium]|nr:tetraacyldisaccharide 4'-kinase [Candidatus Omnitrophota bacterium]
MFIIYDMLFGIFALAYFPYILIKRKWHKGYMQRLGCFSPGVFLQKENIWIHAVSVGEVTAVIQLARAIKQKYPEYGLVVSTVTRTGHEIACRHFKDEAVVIYSPLDLSLIVRIFIRRIRPVIYIAAETEIWPNLYWALHRSGIPIAQINGRISDKTYQGYRRWRFLFQGIIGEVAKFCMQSEEDGRRIMTLGANPGQVLVTGNLKFDLPPEPRPAALADFGYAPGEQIFTAGSTHPGEEEIVLSVFKNLVGKFGRLRLVIVPRHIERAAAVADIVRKCGYNPALFSKRAGSLDPADVLVVDQIGVLKDFYAISHIVFIGKTFMVGGGQNMIEPAALGKPTFVGPLTGNFKDVMRVLLANQAVIQVNSPEELFWKMAQILSDKNLYARVRQSAVKTICDNRGATERTLQELDSLLKSRVSRFKGEDWRKARSSRREGKQDKGMGFLLQVVKGESAGPGIEIIKLFLLFCSWGYTLAVRLILLAYGWGLLRKQKIPCSVISIGNMTMGGTGKTPLVALVAAEFKNRGLKPVILTRGYQGPGHDADREADEARMLREKLPGVPVLVGPDRAGQAAGFLREARPDVFLLDDGFQHWRLCRDFDIVVIDATNPWGFGAVIPRGLLREPLSGLKRADCFVLTKCAAGQNNIPEIYSWLAGLAPGRPVYQTNHIAEAFADLRSGKDIPLTSMKGKTAVGFCGIADPASFENTLAETGVKIARLFSFLDHHSYQEQDILEIVSFCQTVGIKTLITTHKDAVKLEKLIALIPDDLQILNLKMRLGFKTEQEEFFERLRVVLSR